MTPTPAPERWRRIEDVLAQALQRSPDTRDAFLNAECASDTELRREVDSLLAAHERQGAVDRLAADIEPLAAQLRPSDDTLSGRTIGHYVLGERVGGGGMGVVYKAHDTRLGRIVALKFLQAHFASEDKAAERFRLEARAIAALEHPNICTVHEIGETDDGRLYLTMPLYEGETLQQRIARGPLPIGEAVSIAVQVARGLAKAHARGIVHRDVKPSNVFITSDGVAKLLDFGIAKLVDVTLTGTAVGPLGTVAYMSPEQAMGVGVDHRTDLWALGVVLYEMLTGERPPSGMAIAMRDPGQRTATPRPSAQRPEVSAALDRIVQRSLAWSADERYQGAQELERELLALGYSTDVPGGGAPVASGSARPAAGRVPAWRSRRAAIAGVATGVLALAGWFGTARLRDEGRGAAAGVAPAATTIAVLPFADRSPSGDQEYFSDGITDELIATLARVDGLRVASRTSAFAYKGRNADIRTVGAQLGVDKVLEGSVRRAGNRLRITAQLVNVADGYQLWNESYDREAGEGFAIQEEIARAIAQTLQVRLIGAVARGGEGSAPDAEAYDLYLKGRHEWYRRTEDGLRNAVKYFEQAVARAPGYARAHTGLADAYAVLGFYDYLPPAEAFPKAEEAANRAVALDPTLAAPHATLGYVALYHHWDFVRGEESFRRAIALDPNYSTAHQWYANLLTAAGRFSEAEGEMRRAQQDDPLSLIATVALGWVQYHAGSNTAALDQLRRAMEQDPNYALTHLWESMTLEAMDSLGAAVEASRRAVATSDSGAIHVAQLARVLALSASRGEAERLLQRLLVRGSGGGYVPSYEVAKIYEALGQPEQAFAWLERARAQRSHSLVFLRVDPQLSRLRKDERFERLAARVFGG
ncbi:MAG TPA: protein kinase [Gemmatimonadaceae bacterium]|nr:protein kinase [Gemmatimonadaceae bacterium]